MEFFVNKIVDYPVASKINVEKINELLSSRAPFTRFRDIHKWAVTIVAREPNDHTFDTWQKDGIIYFVIPLIYEEVLRETEEEITRRCGELFEYYVNLPTGS